MPKYTADVVAGYILYFTSKCVVEAMHVHASDKALSERNSAKLFVYKSGDTKVMKSGSVNATDMATIREYIKNNHVIMYQKWKEYSDNGYYES